MSFETFISLLANSAILLGLSVVHDTIAIRPHKYPLLNKIIIGVLLGLIAIALMSTPWVFGGGIIFDTRTILLSITGLFFGWIPTLIAVLIAASYRLMQSGGGVYMGVLTILSSAGYGLIWNHLHIKRNWKYNFSEFYMLGLVTHITMVLLMFTLPKAQQLGVFKTTALPVLIIYPFATVILGKLHALHLFRESEKKKIIASEELFNSIANTSPPIWMSGLDMGCFWFNKSWLDFRGRTLEQEYGNGWAEGVHPDDYDHCLKIYTESFARREGFLMEYRMLRFDGMYRWVMDRGKPRYDENGTFLGFIGTCIDNNDLKIAQETLKTTEEEFSIFFNNALDLFCIASMEGYFIRLNKQWEVTLGYTLAELMQKPFLEFIHPEDLNGTIESISQLNEQHSIDSFVNRYRHKDGSYRWIEWKSFPVGNRIYAAARDITYRINNEKEILKLNRDLEKHVEERTTELKQANEELEAYTSSVAHDLKAPLRAISGFADIILEDFSAVLGDTGLSYLNRIASNVSRMDRLITDLILFSRISKADMSITSIDMKKLAETVIDELLDPEQKQQFSVVIGDLPIAKGDKKLLKQVLENLVANAIKFTEPANDKQITIRGHNTGLASVYMITDTGVGFNPEHKEAIFGLFTKVHNQDEFDGTGVGLAIVKRIVGRHGGRVWAESKIGYGSEFSFLLPFK